MTRSYRRTVLEGNTERTLAYCWIGLSLFSAFGFSAVVGDWGLGYESVLAILVFGLVGGVLVFVDSYRRTPRRVMRWAISVGLIGAPPFALLFGPVAFAYFVVPTRGPGVQLVQWLAAGFAATLWVGIDLQGLRRRVAANHYMEHEFVEFDQHVEMRWDRKTDTEAPPIDDGTLLGRLWNRHALKLLVVCAPLSGAGYASVRLMEKAGGKEAILLALAVLSLPLCMFITSKLVCGAYLNLYKVWQVERRTGKPVLFDYIPAE